MTPISARSSLLAPRYLVCIVALIAATLSAKPSDTIAGELQWQRGRTPTAQKTQAAAQRSATFRRFRDRAVHQAAFEEEAVAGPRLTSADEGRATFHSIVVRGEEESNVRSAQLPSMNDTAPPSGTPTTPGTDNSLEEKIGLPFGELPGQEPLETPEFETPGLPGEEQGRTPPENNVRQPPGQTPRTFQTFPPPERGMTETDVEQELAPDVTAQTPEPGTTQESCEESWSNLKAKTIDTVSLDIAVTGTEGDDFPYECAIEDQGLTPSRCWPQVTYLWKASALCHKPLYFEDEQLERYGHSWPPCVQPFVSGAHFFCTLPVLPYCMGVEPPTECIYALGHYRPGSCAPYMIDPVPLSPRGAIIQSAAVTGAVFALP